MTQGTVLVVDDDPRILEFVAEALEDEGYHVLQAVGGASLPLAREAQPRLILLDITMPGMDGVEVSRHLRGEASTAHIPIVAMSAKARRDASDMIADAWLPKPFELDELYRVVARWTAAPR